jgi:hypothetical protein
MNLAHVIVVSIPAEEHNIHIHTSQLIPQVVPMHLTPCGQHCIRYKNIFTSCRSGHKTFPGLYSRWFESMYTLQEKPNIHDMYASCASPRTWQYFTLTQQSSTDSLLPRKSAPDSTSQLGWVAHETRLNFSPNTTIDAVHLSQTSVDEQATRLTRRISPARNQYVQYLLAGANPLVLNRHRRGLPLWRCWLATYHSLTFPIDGLHFPSKGLARSQVIQYQHKPLAILRVKHLAAEWPPCHSISVNPYNYA